MASTSQYSKEYICPQYQRGMCSYGKKCLYRHDEQGIDVIPAHRRVKESQREKYGEQALTMEEQWQKAEPLQSVKNSKGVTYHLYNDPFKESRIGLVQAVRSMQKSVIIKAMWISYIQNHTNSTRHYFADDFKPSHDPQEYDEHTLLNFISQCRRQHSDDAELVKYIIEKEVKKTRQL